MVIAALNNHIEIAQLLIEHLYDEMSSDVTSKAMDHAKNHSNGEIFDMLETKQILKLGMEADEADKIVKVETMESLGTETSKLVGQLQVVKGILDKRFTVAFAPATTVDHAST